MREMLEPVFGASGAIIAQFVITLIVVLALVGVVVWLVRRYAAGGLGTTVRGRLPRLAVVDALAIDTRRKLVLVRRDNVEHLVLIGGPADLVVEAGILRARTVSQRSTAAATSPLQQPAAAAMAPMADSPEPPPVEQTPTVRAPAAVVDEPIPFPPRRTERATARRELPRQAASPREAEIALQRHPSRPAAVEPAAAEEARIAAFAPIEPSPQYEPAPSLGDTAPPPMVEATEDQEVPAAGGSDTGLFTSALEIVDPDAEDREAPGAAPMTGEEEGPTPAEPTTATRVNDLEREMARLLGEISSRRSS